MVCSFFNALVLTCSPWTGIIRYHLGRCKKYTFPCLQRATEGWSLYFNKPCWWLWYLVKFKTPWAYQSSPEGSSLGRCSRNLLRVISSPVGKENAQVDLTSACGSLTSLPQSPPPKPSCPSVSYPVDELPDSEEDSVCTVHTKGFIKGFKFLGTGPQCEACTYTVLQLDHWLLQHTCRNLFCVIAEECLDFLAVGHCACNLSVSHIPIRVAQVMLCFPRTPYSQWLKTTKAYFLL